jgi:glycosyltransferase involved in cell wall biosynthesis
MFWQLAAELARRGHELHVITSDSISHEERTDRIRERMAPDVEVWRYRNRFNRLSAHLSPVFYRPIGMRRGLEEAAGWADVVHVGEARGSHSLWASCATARQGVPLVWSAYGGLPRAHGARGAYRRVYDIAVTRRVIPRVTSFVAQTEHEKQVYLGHGVPSERIRLIPLGVTCEDFKSLPDRGGFRAHLGLRDTDHLVVSVARLSPVKGLDMLIRSFAVLPPSDHGPYLALVGWDHGAEGSLRALVSKLGLKGRVLFPGALVGAARIPAYVDADVFALTPCVYEETSMAVLEAAACGTPTLVTHECEVPGLAESGGGMVAERAEGTLATALAGLLGDPDLRRGVGERARQLVRERFAIEHVAQAHEALFQEVSR